MNQHANILLEIGCAELPARSQFPLIEQMAKLFETKLKAAQFEHGNITPWVSPRRLAIRVDAVTTLQADKTITRKGPAIAAAYDKDGKPTPALLGFMKANSLQLADVSEQQGYAVATILEKGKSLQAFLPELVTDVIKSLAIPKPMRWGESEIAFLRPVSWLVLLLDETVVDVSLFGLSSGRTSYGHRFHAPEAIDIQSPLTYETQLEQACVAVNQAKRRECILTNIDKLTKPLGATAVIPEALLEEVIGLVEWPTALLCPFDKAFLNVPKEALILAMQQHQKSFALVKDDKLLPYFITIANIESRDEKRVIEGNARVMHARLADAAFFYEHDKQTKLEDFAKQLSHVTFQDKLGSLHDKTERVKALALEIAKALGLDNDKKLVINLSSAADLYKADLMTRMVGEFPELQGMMGYYYAKAEGLDDAVAVALRDYYHPRFAEDTLPETTIGQILALAERIDTLVGIFAINYRPTGDKDPYGLRRSALGVIHILIEKQWDIDFFVLFEKHIEICDKRHNLGINKKIEPGAIIVGKGELKEDGVHLSGQNFIRFDLTVFIYERLKAYGLSQGLTFDSYNAVADWNDGLTPEKSLINMRFLYDKYVRWQALDQFRIQQECSRLAEANKRVNNILNKASSTGDQQVTPANRSVEISSVTPQLFSQDEEKQLYQTLVSVQEKLTAQEKQHNYLEAFMSLMPLCEPIDSFFDKVMVNVDDESVRQNRLALLHELKKTLQQVADLSQLQS